MKKINKNKVSMIPNIFMEEINSNFLLISGIKRPPQNKKAFTLVELIIVITILAILATIAFTSFQNYMKSARDGNRVATLKNIESGLNLSNIKTGKYPTPDENIEISSGTTIYINQGIIGQIVSNEIKLNKEPKDPKDNTNYLYSTDKNNRKYQLGIYLEEDNKLLLSYFNFPQTYASSINYDDRYFYTIGNKVGILTKTTNEPLLKTGSFTGVYLSEGDDYKIHFSNDINSGSITGSGNTLVDKIIENQANNKSSKLPIIEEPIYNKWGDGINFISPYLTAVATGSTRFSFEKGSKGPTGVVKDLTTGLMWQSEGNAQGTMNWDNAKSYCSSLTLGDYTDWRVPDLTELFSITNLETYGPALDTNYFNNNSNNRQRSSTTHSYNITSPRVVYFLNGSTESSTNDTLNRVMCVRGNSTKLPWQGTPINTYDSEHNVGTNYMARARFSFEKGSKGPTGVVKDSITGLMWQSEGEEQGYKTWLEAKSYCADLTLGDYTNWRVPNIKELYSIEDFTKSDYSVNEDYFNLTNLTHWSSTTDTTDDTRAWTIKFTHGNISSQDATNNTKLHVVCVR
ncbi:DUF1566 domain-containing protein [Candidatus Gracilibacteria bacterium]|nr:DUF1566 domain-containing protein [Candidatus Gracilibacteria bacterium]